MIIVIEGPDNAGKSTLARYISQRILWPIIYSEGPGKSEQEINDRVRRYSLFDNVIFDRHPSISQTLYNRFRTGGPAIYAENILQFYESDPLFIFCQGRDLSTHQIKEHDTPDHLELVEKNHGDLCRLYDEWAVNHAHIWYRVGNSMERIANMVKGAMK